MSLNKGERDYYAQTYDVSVPDRPEEIDCDTSAAHTHVPMRMNRCFRRVWLSRGQ
jgi:hypothetical protein